MNKVNFINKTKKQLARLSAILAPLPLGRGWGWVLGVLLLASCSDILDTSSELVEFQEDNTLDHPTDSVYSVMGIVNRMQLIADRSVLLGEIRSDLVTPTEAASADLKRLAAFDFAEPNKYCQVSDYYAVINNCNYYLANVDTTLQRRGRTLFRYEYAAVKAFRAWTYLELVKNYGQVPLVTEPVMTEREAEEALTRRVATIKEVCDYFIADLTPYALVELPQYGDINSYTSTEFFIPMRALLGDLCLWAGRYQEAARWYHDYLNDKERFITLNSSNRVRWTSVTDFQRPTDAYSTQGNEVISRIPMEQRVFDGIVSDLLNVFSSTRENNYFFQVTPSAGMRQLSADQVYCMEYKTETTTDTVYVPRSGFTDNILVGDLRLSSNYKKTSQGGQDEYSEYSTLRQTIGKHTANSITTYRRTMVYLRYAEALNRSGLPQSAFAVLKYGLCAENNRTHIDSLEQVAAGDLITFDETAFTRETVIGIHSIGSGDSECNAYYDIPQPSTPLASRQDTIAYQIPLVEDRIVTEMALEGAFEGYRFYDLMRIALRRGDPSYLANPVSRRNGTSDPAVRAHLMDTSNWYLPLK
ncbi:MAG: RagB/SusD family nutrient uptake outer membrane protein [Prevotella sp.]|nr:RagB/SusD family nutrient uptake outer membrane protein [Prevotella sp.]